MNQKHPPSRVIAVDVDGTLHHDGRVNAALVEYCRAKKAEGYRLMLWSARGIDHAQRAVELFDLAGLFDDVVGKPGYIIDDLGWTWVKYTRVIAKPGDRL